MEMQNYLHLSRYCIGLLLNCFGKQLFKGVHMKAKFAVIAGLALGLLTSHASLSLAAAETSATCADSSYMGVLAVMSQSSDDQTEKLPVSALIADSEACRSLLKTVQAEAVKAKASGELSPLLKEQFSEIQVIDTTISKDQMVNALIEAGTDK